MTRLNDRIERRPLVEQVRERLVQGIADGVYAVGGKLPAEPELQDMFGVGRSTVREAVRTLAHDGMLEVRPGNGTFVVQSAPQGESLAMRLHRARAKEVYEVRRALELEAVRLAAERRTTSDLRKLKADLRRRKRFVDDPTEFLNADLDFHLQISKATKNAVFADLYETFFAALREALTQSASLPGIRASGQAVHEEIYDAIERRDGAAAVAAMEKILSATADRLATVLDENPARS